MEQLYVYITRDIMNWFRETLQDIPHRFIGTSMCLHLNRFSLYVSDVSQMYENTYVDGGTNSQRCLDSQGYAAVCRADVGDLVHSI